MKKSKGFTFVEILVVATIIGLLASVAAVSYSQFSKQSRDARRKGDIEQVRAALEMYRSNTDTYITTSDLSPLVGSYIQSIPTDPKTLLGYTYTPLNCSGTPLVCSSYTLSATLENGGTYTAGPYGAVVTTPTPGPTSTPVPPTSTPVPPTSTPGFIPLPTPTCNPQIC